MKRAQRLQAAQKFLKKYEGKRIVYGYKKRFGVSALCAAIELKMLGHKIADELIEHYRKEEARRAELRRRKKEITQQDFCECDDYFAFIAGYTFGGAPYGITWEEWEKLETPPNEKTIEEKMDHDKNPYESDELPF